MTARMNLFAVLPDAYKAFIGVETSVMAHLDHRLVLLVKTRASMTNGCAYCIDMHTTHALAEGEDVQRLVGLAAWRESPSYSERERTALALTDEVTALGPDGVSDEVWDEAVDTFSEDELAHLLVAIAMINLWNRISVTTRTVPASASAVRSPAAAAPAA
jgi:AhpD family alkylhydroperoxidase